MPSSKTGDIRASFDFFTLQDRVGDVSYLDVELKAYPNFIAFMGEVASY